MPHAELADKLQVDVTNYDEASGGREWGNSPIIQLKIVCCGVKHFSDEEQDVHVDLCANTKATHFGKPVTDIHTSTASD